MKLECRHGYFVFEETRCGEISDFMSLTGFEIIRKDDHFTFADLEEAPDFTISGGTFLTGIAIKDYEGEPWEVMRANTLVYNFMTGLVVPIATIVQRIEIEQTANYFLSGGLILPGSITDDGSKVTDYAGWFYFDSLKFRYSEVSYE